MHGLMRGTATREDVRAYLALLDRTIEQGARVSDVWLYLRTSFVAIERLAGAR